MLRGLRGASALRALRSTSRYASTSTSKLIETELSPSGVLTISFHNEKKLNAWTQSLMKQMAAEISAADTRDDVRGVVLTGGGAYYSAGVDLSGLLQPMMPSKLQTQLREERVEAQRPRGRPRPPPRALLVPVPRDRRRREPHHHLADAHVHVPDAGVGGGDAEIRPRLPPGVGEEVSSCPLGVWPPASIG